MAFAYSPNAKYGKPGLPGLGGTPIAPKSPLYEFGSPNTFSTAVGQQAGDYDRIMDTYKQLGTRQSTFNPLTPQLAPDYAQSADTASAIGSLKNLTDTGGYSKEGIADLRARGIAPIRSIYSSAQRNMERQKNLSGGYAPGFGASQSKLAREQADQLGKITTDVNANIAENVARNRLTASGQYAGASQNEDRARMAREEANTNIINEINKINESIRLQVQAANNQNLLSSAEGMKSLYGTTPALAQMFGQQVAEATQLGQNQQQINNQQKARQQDLATSVAFGGKRG